MTCRHGFIGACGDCDGAGQIPEAPPATACGCAASDARVCWMVRHGELDGINPRCYCACHAAPSPSDFGPACAAGCGRAVREPGVCQACRMEIRA